MHSHTNIALSRLLQLASPMLPVGAYSYSQGLEWAIESGDVYNADSAALWIRDVLEYYQVRYELPMLYQLYQAWQAGNLAEIRELDAQFQAGRDSAEALAESRQMGYSLRRLLNELGLENLNSASSTFLAQLQQLETPAFPTVYAGVAELWEIPAPDMLHAYAWSWLENQVSVAMKTVPLGQVAGQKILLQLGNRLPACIQEAMHLEEGAWSNFAPGLSIASCRHETQYSRLFRS